jgi:hypothetical protein
MQRSTLQLRTAEGLAPGSSSNPVVSLSAAPGHDCRPHADAHLSRYYRGRATLRVSVQSRHPPPAHRNRLRTSTALPSHLATSCCARPRLSPALRRGACNISSPRSSAHQHADIQVAALLRIGSISIRSQLRASYRRHWLRRIAKHLTRCLRMIELPCTLRHCFQQARGTMVIMVPVTNPSA